MYFYYGCSLLDDRFGMTVLRAQWNALYYDDILVRFESSFGYGGNETNLFLRVS
jgi:hypothetical protein